MWHVVTVLKWISEYNEAIACAAVMFKQGDKVLSLTRDKKKGPDMVRLIILSILSLKKGIPPLPINILLFFSNSFILNNYFKALQFFK